MTTRRLILTPTEALAAYKGELAEVRRKVTRGNSRWMGQMRRTAKAGNHVAWDNFAFPKATVIGWGNIRGLKMPYLRGGGTLELWPAIQPGDVLWGTEAFWVPRFLPTHGDRAEYQYKNLRFNADQPPVRDDAHLFYMRSSTSMPRRASRHRFTVASVGVDVSGEWPEWVIGLEVSK